MIVVNPHFDPRNWRTILDHGSGGSDVSAWQTVLIYEGSDLSTDRPGIFGDATHNATINYQLRHGLVVDGIVGPKTRATIGAPRRTIPKAFSFPTEIDFIEAAHWSRNIPARDRVDWIVLHSMETPESATRAEVCAANMAAGHRKASAHYCVDCDSIVQCVKEDRIAWHAPGANNRGIGIEHAGKARQTADQWFDEFSKNMLLLSVNLAAGICKRWNIPPEIINARGLKRGVRGITTHEAVSDAFRKSTHTDPGSGFPLVWYAEKVKEAISLLG
jgi:hypothetical protein